jgi:hypothetical protein
VGDRLRATGSWPILRTMVDTNSTSQVGLFEAIHSARSLRRFKPDPVLEALLEQILDAAIRARHRPATPLGAHG